jgi:penicillin-insensitive murein endopeptidase
MPLFLGEHRVMGWWSVRLAVPLCLVAVAGSAASATRPELVVSRAPFVATPPATPSASLDGLLELEPVTIRPERHHLDGLSATALHALALTTPDKLGPAVVGRPNRGKLWNPVRLESGPGLEVMNDERNYATRATVNAIREAAAEVERQIPGSVLRVGDLSGRRGGYIRPHRSHQAGVDADIGFYYRTPAKWYTKANASNLDRERTWALVKALIAQGTVEYLFVDRSIQVLLRDYALSVGEPREFVDGLFETPAKRDTLIRHTWGHLTHFHVRFLDPVAEETGRRAGPSLEKAAWSLKAKPGQKKR